MNEERPELNNSDQPPLPISKTSTLEGSPNKLNWKSQFQELKTKLIQSLNKERLQKAIQNFDPQMLADWVSKAVQKHGLGFYGTVGAIALSTYFISDLTALVVSEYIPAPNNSRNTRMRSNFPHFKSINDYSSIISRNLFNSHGLIPGEEENTGSPKDADLGGAPIKTTLPLNLIGTLIMSNELRSIATLEDKSASLVYPVQVNDEIPGKVKIIKIEPKKVIFLNKASSRREYVELPDDSQNQNPRLLLTKSKGGIEKVAPTQFNVSRTEVDRALADFNNILTQARAVPNFENGIAAGYKLFQIVPGSIYDKLGLQNGDVITGLNGQPMNDPGKAFEMLNELKTSSHLELQVKKDGRPITYTYDIH